MLQQRTINKIQTTLQRNQDLPRNICQEVKILLYDSRTEKALSYFHNCCISVELGITTEMPDWEANSCRPGNLGHAITFVFLLPNIPPPPGTLPCICILAHLTTPACLHHCLPLTTHCKEILSHAPLRALNGPAGDRSSCRRLIYIRGVQLVAGEPDASCAGHSDPGSTKGKNIAKCHTMQCDTMRLTPMIYMFTNSWHQFYGT